MQKEKTVFYKSALAASSLFVVGNAIIVLPAKTADKYTLLGLGIAAITGILLNIILLPLAYSLYDKRKMGGCIQKLCKTVIFLIIAVAALFFAADTFEDFLYFVNSLILPEIPLTAITLTFAFIIAFFFYKRQEDVLKFSFLCFVFMLLAVLFFFLCMSGNFDVQNIIIRSLPDLKELKNSILPYLLKATLPGVLLPFYHTAVIGKRAGSACVIGTAAGYMVLCLCVIPCVLLFSPALAGNLSYPYASAVSTVTVGKIFTRLDGFSYFLYFSAALSKINICLFTVKFTLKKLSQLYR